MNSISSTNFMGVNATPSKKTTNAEVAAKQEAPEMKEIPTSYAPEFINATQMVQKGDPILENGYSVLTKPGKAELRLAKGTEVLANIWDKSGGVYEPGKDDIIMYYGPAEKSWGIKNPKVLAEMEAKGMETYPDHAVSNQSTIYRTYVGEDGRDFNTAPLQPNERVASEKIQFPGKVSFPAPGSIIKTLEVVNGTGKPHVIAPFQFVVTDVDGYPYAKDVSDLKGRYVPNSDESKELFAKVNDLVAKRKEVTEQGLTPKAEEAVLTKIWMDALPELNK